MKAKNIMYTVLAGVLASFAIAPTNVSAREICFDQYGGGEECIEVDENSRIDVDKEVSEKDGDYQDHLKSSEHKFDAGEKVYFKIKVKNTGEVDLKNVEVRDTLPDFIKFDKEIDGDADVDGSHVTFDLGDLDAGEEKTVKFVAKVEDEEDLPMDDKICLTNIAKAKGEREDNGDDEKDSDYANFCIELPDVLGEEAPTELPKAGAPLNLALAGIASLAGGVLYRKRINQ